MLFLLKVFQIMYNQITLSMYVCNFTENTKVCAVIELRMPKPLARGERFAHARAADPPICGRGYTSEAAPLLTLMDGLAF